jgi:hypothetical protein
MYEFGIAVTWVMRLRLYPQCGMMPTGKADCLSEIKQGQMKLSWHQYSLELCHYAQRIFY